MDCREGRSQRLQPIRLSQGLAKLDDFVKKEFWLNATYGYHSLRPHGLDKPTRLEQNNKAYGRLCPMNISLTCCHRYNDKIKQTEGQNIKGRRDRSHPNHETCDRLSFPGMRISQKIFVHLVKRQGNTRQIID